jgi:CheY-like chemotaxis protein
MARRDDCRILVVEDDPTMLALWDRLLMKLGICQRVLITNSLQAKNLLERSRFDLLISDVIMPSMSGYELARFAKAMNPDMEVVLTTAYNTDLSRFDLKGLKLHLLHKPYTDLEGLANMINHLIHDEDVYEDADEDSWSDNEDYPEVTEWKL